VGLLPRKLEIACIDLHQTGYVGEGSDHLQLIKFWPSRTPGKGVCGGAKFFGSALLQPARMCLRLFERFFSLGYVVEEYIGLDSVLVKIGIHHFSSIGKNAKLYSL